MKIVDTRSDRFGLSKMRASQERVLNVFFPFLRFSFACVYLVYARPDTLYNRRKLAVLEERFGDCGSKEAESQMES